MSWCYTKKLWCCVRWPILIMFKLVCQIYAKTIFQSRLWIMVVDGVSVFPMLCYNSCTNISRIMFVDNEILLGTFFCMCGFVLFLNWIERCGGEFEFITGFHLVTNLKLLTINLNLVWVFLWNFLRQETT